MSTAQSFEWDPQTDPTVDTAEWTYVADLPVPPELAREIERTLKDCGWWTSKCERTFHEDELKLQYHFGGKAVLLIKTPRGRAIIASGPADCEEVGRLLNALPRSVRSKTLLYFPDPWADRFDPYAPTIV
jgi:hypothetical protein